MFHWVVKSFIQASTIPYNAMSWHFNEDAVFTLLCAITGFTCLMASTIVTVLPVPGGPNTRYGAGLDVPATMWHTALYCSGFLWSCWSKNLETHTLCSNTHNVSFWSFNKILIGVLLTSVQVETQGSSSLSLWGTACLWACVGPPCVLLCVAVLTGDDSL